MGVKNLVKRVGDRAGNRVAKLSELSTYQVEEVQFQREQYLLSEPNPNDEIAVERTERLMAASSIEIFNAYLPQIKDLYIPISKDAEYESAFDPLHNIGISISPNGLQIPKRIILKNLSMYMLYFQTRIAILHWYSIVQDRVQMYISP